MINYHNESKSFSNNNESKMSIDVKDDQGNNKRPSFKIYEPKELIDKITYGEHQFRIIFLAVVLLLMEGAELHLVAYLITSLRKYFNAETFEIEITAAIVYLGLGIGSFSVDYVKKVINRKQIVFYTLIGINICHVLLIFAKSIAFFTFIRFLIGLQMGLTNPIVLNVLCEYLPIEYRTFTMNSTYCGFNIGQLLLLLVQMIVMPKFEENQVITVLLILWFIIFLCTVMFFFLFEDSPRNLVLEGEVNKGIKIFREMLHKNNIYISSEQRKQLVDYIKNTNNRIKEANFSAVFENEFLRTSILLSFIWFLNSNLRYGPLLIYTETLQEMKISTDTNIIINHIVIVVGMFVSNLIFSWISEFKNVGLIRMSLICYGLALIFNILIVTVTGSLNIWFTIASVLYNPANSAMGTYTHLIYPTKIRDTSFGLFLFFKRVGGIISQFLFLGLSKAGVIVPYHILLWIVVMISILIYFLPFEPSHDHLDVKHELSSDKNDN
jgi:sugar phosphate permease